MDRAERLKYDNEAVTITMTRKDWVLIRDYFEGDIETMGDDPAKQRRARKAQTWLSLRIVNGNAKRRQGFTKPKAR